MEPLDFSSRGMKHGFACHLISSIYAPGSDIGTNKRTTFNDLHASVLDTEHVHTGSYKSSVTTGKPVQQLRPILLKFRIFYGKIPGVWLPVHFHLPLYKHLHVEHF